MSTARYFEVARPLFKGRMKQAQVDGQLAIIAEAKERRVNRQQLAYILATVFHETGGRMVPVLETFATSADDAARRLQRAFDEGKLRWVKKPYWQQDTETGERYLGRGYVQITWRDNYARLGKLLGVDLERKPDLALDPDVSLDILFEGMLRGLFTGKSLDDVSEPASSEPDFTDDRVVVNGKDRAAMIARYADVFYEALADVDLLERSRTIKAAKDQKVAANWGIGAAAGGAVLSGAEAVVEALGGPETAISAAQAADSLSTYLPVLGGSLIVVAVIALLIVKWRAKKIEDARREDHETQKAGLA